MENTFTPITTQEGFDKAIQARLEREQAKYKDFETFREKAGKYDALIEKDYEGQIRTLNEKITEQNGKITELEARAGTAETRLTKSRIAQELGLPYELADRLTGKNEKEIRADAEALSKIVVTGSQQQPAPLKSTEPGNVSSTDAAYASLLSGLKGE